MIRPQFGSVSTPSFGAPRGTVQSVTGHTGCAAGRRFEMHGDLNGARSKLFSDREDRQAGTKIQMCFMRRANYGTRLAAIARARGLSNCNQLQSVNRGHARTGRPRDTLFCFVSSTANRQPPRHSCVVRTLRFSMASASTSTQAPAQAGKCTQPLVAQGDWTKNLVQLAKTAELK